MKITTLLRVILAALNNFSLLFNGHKWINKEAKEKLELIEANKKLVSKTRY